MSTKHTPGPWKTRRFDNEADGRHNFTVQAALCEVARMSQVDQDVAEANARLIAAAPELLALAEKTEQLAGIAPWVGDPEMKRLLLSVADEARALIAKSTGK